MDRIESLYKLTKTYINLFTNRSEVERWKDESSFDEEWSSRTKLIAQYVPKNSRVLEFGAGKMELEAQIPDSCDYKPSDIVKRNDDVMICDLNSKKLPDIEKYDVTVFSGVLEYVYNIERTAEYLSKHVNLVLASYAVTDNFQRKLERRSYGWVNDYSTEEIITLFRQKGFSSSVVDQWNDQIILRAIKSEE